MSKLRILYVASEVSPFIQTSLVADYIRNIPQAMQDLGLEIRILSPKFGLINERKNRLHEVVRLSGINITVGEDEKPLVIKVASIPTARMQVYFIDNDDYFHRKGTFFDKNNHFYPDNHERIVFFNKGALETVKKLGWSPDIIHCADWSAGLIPLYIKTAYRNDPVFKNSKTVFTVFDNHFPDVFHPDLLEYAKAFNVTPELLEPLSGLNYEGMVNMGCKHADVVLKTKEEYKPITANLLAEVEKKRKIDFLDYEPELISADAIINLYQNISFAETL